MGCDIHLHQEVKINGKWEHYGIADVTRNYQLFAKMAGVRGDEAPIAEPRGYPVDVTNVTQFDAARWASDSHTPSWLDAEEITKLFEWMKEPGETRPREWFGYLFGNHWDSFTKYPEDRPAGLEDVRFVFWFDN